MPELWGWVRAAARSTDARVATGIVARENQLEAGMIGINSYQISVSESPFGGIKDAARSASDSGARVIPDLRTMGYVFSTHGIRQRRRLGIVNGQGSAG